MKTEHGGYCSCKECMNTLAKKTGLSYSKVKKLLKGFKKGEGKLLFTPLRDWHEGVELYATLKKQVK